MQKKFLRRKRLLAVKGRRHIRKLKIMSRHPFAVPVGIFLILVLVSTVGYVTFFHQTVSNTVDRNTRIVILSYDKKKLIVPAEPQTVSSLLKKLRITLHTGDVVEPEPSTKILQDNFRVNIYRAVPVNVVADDGSNTFAYSAATTPRSIAAQAGITVYSEDSVTSEPVTNFIKQQSIGEQIIVKRSQPINLNLYGTAAPTRTLAKTVGGMLAEKHIKLADGSTVTPAADAAIAPNMQVFILAKGVSIVTEQQTIATPVQNVNDGNLTLGTRAIRQAGSPGAQLVTYQVKVNPATGQEISRTVIQTVVTQTPVTQIVAVGTNVNIPQDKLSIMQAAGIRSSDYGYVDYIVSHEGGWCATKAQGHYGSCPAYTGYVPSSGGYGICQSTPPSKMASAGSDWQYNPVTQLRWCAGYAQSRYGGWSAAYNHWLSNHNW